MRRPVLLVVLVLGLGLAVPGPAQAARLPSKATWERDVARVMAGSVDRLRARVADRERGERLAINLDIDNTSLASHYDRGAPVAPVLRLARAADRLGVSVVFNTARPADGLAGITQVLRDAGYPVDDICGRRDGQRVRDSKQACRDRYRDQGLTLVANVGNTRTDFIGDGYERAYRLPSYGGRLG